ncbi:MAG: hypothetical protein ACC662_12000, partial [Planctomycetota bacterium]
LSARALEEGEAPPEGVAVEVEGTGATREDQGFVGFDLVRVRGAPEVRVEVTVRNDAEAARTRTLTLRIGEDEVARRLLPVPGGGSASATFEVEVPRGGAWLTVRFEGRDAFAADDRLEAWLAPPLRPSVLVVRGAAVRPYTRAVIEAMAGDLDLEASGSVAAKDLLRAAPRDVTLVDGVALPAGSLRPGAWIFLAPLGGDLPFDVGEALEEPIVWRTAPDHPLLLDVDLATAYVARAQPLSGPGLEGLAEADGKIVVGEGAREGIRYVALGLDPEESDLPVRTALPLLVRNAIRRLAAAPSDPFRPFYRPGERLRPRRPLPSGPDVLVSWDDTERRAHLEVEGKGLEIPAGATGRVEIRAPASPDGGTWRGRTAFVDLDPERTIRPVRPPGARPPPSPPASEPRVRWRRALVAVAILALLLDVLVVLGGGGGRARPGELAPPSALT